MSVDCWTLTVLRAFADQMDALRPDGVEPTLIGWPTLAFTDVGPWRGFVWFDPDLIDVIDGSDNHQLTVITGIVMREDPSQTELRELEQGIVVYYKMRAAIADGLEKEDSPMNNAFTGAGDTHPEEGGVRPSGAKDFDGIMTLGERWLVVGQGGLTGSLTA